MADRGSQSMKSLSFCARTSMCFARYVLRLRARRGPQKKDDDEWRADPQGGRACALFKTLVCVGFLIVALTLAPFSCSLYTLYQIL